MAIGHPSKASRRSAYVISYFPDDLKASLFVLRNFVLCGHAPYRFDPAYDDDGNSCFMGGEDGDLSMQLIRDGWGAYAIENCVLKELGGATTSTSRVLGTRSSKL